jgi:hypothetical protein
MRSHSEALEPVAKSRRALEIFSTFRINEPAERIAVRVEVRASVAHLRQIGPGRGLVPETSATARSQDAHRLILSAPTAI